MYAHFWSMAAHLLPVCLFCHLLYLAASAYYSVTSIRAPFLVIFTPSLLLYSRIRSVKAAFTRIRIDPDIRMSQLRIGLPSTRKRLKCTLSGAMRYPELFENDFKSGSSGCPGALRTCVNGAFGYPDVTAHAHCGFLRLESG